MIDGQISLSFKLEKRTIGEVEVAWISGLWVDPKGKGIGRHALLFIESIASPLVVVGLASEDVAEFYRACDWVVGGVRNGKRIVASDSIDESKIPEKI